MNDEGMEKYGVDEEQLSKEKRAAQGCPICGAAEVKLIKHGSVILCPNCGSFPFENH